MIYNVKIQQKENENIVYTYKCFHRDEARGYVQAGKQMLPIGKYVVTWHEYDVEREHERKIEFVFKVDEQPKDIDGQTENI